MAGPLLRPAVWAVVFDAVGTLIYPDPSAAEVYHAIGQHFGSRHSLEEIRQRFRATFQVEEARDRAAGLRTSEKRESERWRTIVAAVLDDASDLDACFAELFEHFSRPEAWRCESDADVTLRELERRGYVLAVASNYDRRLRRVAAGLPALTSLKHLIISSEVGWRKPAAEFFTAMCRNVSLPPEQIMFIGDDYGNDYEGAQAAGLQALLFDPQQKSAVSEEQRITRLSEVLNAFS